jgi:RNA polymerase sigma factor (sigma-70 family)
MRIDRLFHMWYPRLVGAIARRLGRDEAEDVAQDAFIRLLDQSPNDPPAWLFTVAGRLATDRQRASARRSAVALETEHPETPDEALLVREQIDVVRRVLGAMPERDRRLLLMHHGGMRYREIADRLGVAASSVGSLLTRAHRRFLRDYQRLTCTTATEPSARFSTASSTQG